MLDVVIRSPISAWPVASLLRRPKAGAAPVPPHLMSVIATTHRAAGAVAAKLLDATSEADLAERIETLVDDGLILQYFEEILADLRAFSTDASLEFNLVVDEGDKEEVAEQYEDDTAALVREALLLHNEAVRGAQVPTGRDLVSAASEDRDRGPYTDLMPQLARLSLPAARAMLESVRGLGAMLALLGSGLDHRKLPGWLACALARTWRDGELAFLKLIALGDPSVSAELLPLAQRLDLATMTEETNATRKRLDELFEQARKSGLPVFPVPSDDDE